MAVALRSQSWLSAVRARPGIVVASALKHICANARFPRPTDSASQKPRRRQARSAANRSSMPGRRTIAADRIRPLVSTGVESAEEAPMSVGLDRRLVAVMFTDMVGYTALVQADEYRVSTGATDR